MTKILLEQARMLFETAAIGIVATAHDGRMLMVNPALETMFGYGPGELTGRPLELLVPEGQRKHHADLRGPYLRAPHARPMGAGLNLWGRCKDGRLFPLEISLSSIELDEGPVALAFVIDISARWAAEAARHASEARNHAVLGALTAHIAVLGEDGTIIAVNTAWERFARANGADPATIGAGASYLAVCHAAAAKGDTLAAAALAGIEAVLSGEQAYFALEYPCHGPGEEHWFVMRVTPLEQHPGVVVAHENISERKLSEMALRRSEWLYRTLAHNFPNGAVMLFDHDYRHIVVDGSGLDALDGSREQIEGRQLHEVFPPTINAALEPLYHEALNGRPGITELVLADHTYAVYALPVRDERGEITGGMIMTQDITERKRIEDSLIEERALLTQRVAERTADLSAANAELARAARLKDEFLASMSHELRTPLNAVLGLSEALREAAYGEVSVAQDHALGMIAESGRHLLELINDILDLAKIGAGKLELELAPVAAATVCQASLRMIKQSALKKQLAVDTALDPAVVTLYADERRLKQILVNLLSNAVKFTPTGGRVGLEVRGDAAHHRVDFTVWDTGIGIAPEHIDHLFQAFVQIDSRLARQYEGTGLGLALVYRMAEMHGGSVAVASELGVGSRFTVSLPWEAVDEPPDHPAPRPITAPVPAATQGARKRHLLLLAEDNEANIVTIGDYLTNAGFEVIIARNGVEAISNAHEHRPALIIMDIQMPGMDGLEATRHIRASANLAATPIIALTALAMPGDRERCIAAGVNDYISKPVSLKGLLARIESSLQRSSYQP